MVNTFILQKTKNQFFITIAKALVIAKKWEKGKKLKQILNKKGNIELEEVK